jgi:hypothetical protein
MRIAWDGEIIPDAVRGASLGHGKVSGVSDLPRESLWEEMGFARPAVNAALPVAKVGRRLRDGKRVSIMPAASEYLDAVPSDVWFMVAMFVVSVVFILGLILLKRRFRARASAPPGLTMDQRVRMEVDRALASSPRRARRDFPVMSKELVVAV